MLNRKLDEWAKKRMLKNWWKVDDNDFYGMITIKREVVIGGNWQGVMQAVANEVRALEMDMLREIRQARAK